MKVWQFILALLALLVSTGLTANFRFAGQTAVGSTPPPTVDTRVAYVAESRALIFAADKAPYAQALAKRMGLTVCLRVVSPLLKNPNCYHHVRIITDVLNTGHTLTPIAPRWNQIVPVQSRLYERMRQAGEVGFPVLLHFLAPAPKAAEIRELIGSMDVMAGGRTTVISLENPAALVGRRINNAALRAANVRIRVTGVTKARHSQFLVVDILAPAGVFESMSVAQKGKIISGGYILAHMPKGEDKLMIPLQHALHASAVLRINVLTGWHEYRVPFSLQHIPLPAAPPPARPRP